MLYTAQVNTRFEAMIMWDGLQLSLISQISDQLVGNAYLQHLIPVFCLPAD